MHNLGSRVVSLCLFFRVSQKKKHDLPSAKALPTHRFSVWGRELRAHPPGQRKAPPSKARISPGPPRELGNFDDGLGGPRALQLQMPSSFEGPEIHHLLGCPNCSPAQSFTSGTSGTRPTETSGAPWRRTYTTGTPEEKRLNPRNELCHSAPQYEGFGG